MAKRITQETFDAVVKENIEEFGMEGQEAVDDVIKQFESQGVNLANIVTTLYLQKESGDNTSHRILESINKIAKIVDGGDYIDEELTESIKIFREECDIDLAHRVLAAANNAFPVLFSLCERFVDDESSLKEVLEALLCLCNGQPDLITLEAIIFMINHLENDSTDVTYLMIKITGVTSIMHEMNRQRYVANGLIEKLLSVLKKENVDCKIVKEACKSLKTLTLDDDIRAPFGKAHEHAKLMVELGAIEAMLDTLKNPLYQDEITLIEVCSMLSKLAVRNEFCQQIVNLGGLKFVLKILAEHLECQEIVKQVFAVLKAIAGNDDVKIAIVNSGGTGFILNAMSKHIKQSQVCALGCGAIGAIVLRNPNHCKVVMDSDGPTVILKAMTLHPNSKAVQTNACMAIRNLIARTKQYCEPILQIGAEELIQQASKQCPDEAKAALRDLGCKVELIERWKGEKNGVVN
ncbi:armadillo repeat-containing protein 6-like [Antedon mediterranea]|uniref:armadillo repeat-containing protein 6-like n=1 Tax=Antedon mediterranea TaxID=105859 RepID=UPI003AF87A30